MDPLVTKMSSKGQVVIPASIRRRLGLAAGDELRISVATQGEPGILLRRLSSEEVQTAIERGYRWLEQGREDLVEALHESRRAARIHERRRR